MRRIQLVNKSGKVVGTSISLPYTGKDCSEGKKFQPIWPLGNVLRIDVSVTQNCLEWNITSNFSDTAKIQAISSPQK